MKKTKICTLKNGMKVIFYQDTSKHRAVANLFVKFGEKNKQVKLDNSLFEIKDGTAHFLEHLLIEHSIYGNALIEFEKNHARFNGCTNKDVTEFYIDSVCNFEDDLIKLINIVNKPNFKDVHIEETKPAIIKEIMMNKDNKFADLYKLDYECLFKNIKYSNILGDISDIESINFRYIKECYEIFYNVENQILFISGNFNINKIKRILENAYNKNIKKEKNYELIKEVEPNEIVKKEAFIKKDVHIDYIRLTYKVNISHLTNKEQVKLTFYLNYFLSYLFNSSSKLYNDLVKEKICDYNIDYSYGLDDKYMLVTIGTYTNNSDKLIKKIKKTIKNKKLDQEDFELNKKQTIIDLILREDNLDNCIGPFISNVLEYNYYYMDTIKDIENQNFKDYQKIINELDFSNYCITKMVKKDKN